MMKRLVMLLVGCLVVGGCGLMMNSEYSQRLEGEGRWSAEQSQKAEAGELAPAEMVQALQDNAAKWRVFKDAQGPWLGVSDVWANATYTRTLAKTVGWSADMARRAAEGALPEDDMKSVLKDNAKLWRLFREGLKGIAPKEDN